MNKMYYIFGAHSRGWTLFEYIRTLYRESRLVAFLYNDQESNPPFIDNIPVYYIKKYNTNSPFSLDTSVTVYIATRGESHDSVTAHLSSLGFSDIIPVTPSWDIELRNKYVDHIFNSQGRKFINFSNEIGSSDNIGSQGSNYDLGLNNRSYLFIARNICDKEFSTPVPIKKYEKIIQVGCELCDEHIDIASFFDDRDDNISIKNRQFCELTALYWIWKNAAEAVVGLEHWRRRFILPDNWIEYMELQGVDVILPVPLCVMPSLEENYKSRHLDYVWDTMLDTMDMIHPECIGARQFFKENNLYSPCNMLIARKDIFDTYCDWLFPVLFRLNEKIGEVEDLYQNRYPGFVSERLLTFYFHMNRDKYNIVYADKSFLN